MNTITLVAVLVLLNETHINRTSLTDIDLQQICNLKKDHPFSVYHLTSILAEYIPVQIRPDANI